MPKGPAKCKHGPTNTFRISTPIGSLELECCPKGLHRLDLPDVTDDNFFPKPSETVHIQEQLYQDNGYTYRSALCCVQWLSWYFNNLHKGHAPATPPICPIEKSSLHAPFTVRVWQALAEKVKHGKTVSYGELAALSGSTPKASRAVGQAMRNNPVMIIIPCHRVILSSGNMGNYAGGKKNYVKTWLLKHEGIL